MDYGGLNIYYINDLESFKKSFQNILNNDHVCDNNSSNKKKKLIITEFIDSYVKELQCKITARVVMIKNYICCYLVEAYNKKKLIYKIKNLNINYVKNNKVETKNLELLNYFKRN